MKFVEPIATFINNSRNHFFEVFTTIIIERNLIQRIDEFSSLRKFNGREKFKLNLSKTQTKFSLSFVRAPKSRSIRGESRCS